MLRYSPSFLAIDPRSKPLDSPHRTMAPLAVAFPALLQVTHYQ
jgi:hypothetical protein